MQKVIDLSTTNGVEAIKPLQNRKHKSCAEPGRNYQTNQLKVSRRSDN